MNITKATLQDIEQLTILFDGYRQFYEQPSDLERAKAFLTERIEQNQSVIYVAYDDNGQGLGFTQLYPTFSSVSMSNRWILNDLFVAGGARKMGVADALMHTAEVFASESGATGLSLSTAIDNESAQALYAKRGWVRGSRFCAYNKLIS